MSNLVVVKNRQAVVSSRQVAEHFEKEHSKVIRAIETIIEGIAKNGDTHSKMFYKATYTNQQNKQKYTEYLMNRDGFMLVVMGFTGDRALEVKMKFLAEFNRMEQELNTPKLATKSVGGALKDVLSARNTIKKLFPAVPDGIAVAKAFEQVETIRGINLDVVKTLIPPDTSGDSECSLKVADIARECNILYTTGSPDSAGVNKRLAALGFQEKDGKEWHVTEQGRKYGAEFPYDRNGHSGYEIRWKRDVIEKVKELRE